MVKALNGPVFPAVIENNVYDVALKEEIRKASFAIEHPPPPEEGKVKRFFKKYFLEGQKLDDDYVKAVAELPKDAPLGERILVKHRRIVGMLIPITFFHLLWWPIAIKWDFFNRFFPTRWVMSIVQFFASAVGGATSEGSGSIAYPVMALGLGLPSSVARDFAIMIQCFGMTSATFCIFWMKIKLEWYSIIYSTIGSTAGMIFGLEIVDHVLTSQQKKLGFVSIWFAFAGALMILNRHKRRTFDSVQDFKAWKGILLVVAGFIGGIFGALVGVGVDICSFSVLCLLFRVSEKVATPTSVVLQAANTLVGFYWRQLLTETGAEPVAWEYLAVTAPIACIAGPLGAWLSSYCHRLVFATFVYVVDLIGLITGYSVIPMTWQLGVMSVALIIGCFAIFFGMSKGGDILLRRHEEKEQLMIANAGNNNSSDVNPSGFDNNAFSKNDV